MFNMLLTTSLSLFYYIATPTAAMREQPSEVSEIVSQAIHSEPISLLEEANGWVKIETLVDHYQGWARKDEIIGRKEAFPISTAAEVAVIKRLSAHVYDTEDTVFGPIITLPYESRLEIVETPKEPNSRWIKVALVDGRIGYVQRGDVALERIQLDRAAAANLSLMFLGLPYTWGGRCSFGYDCSGLTQMLYRQMGHFIPRDSKDQLAWQDFDAVPLDKLQTGDLIFFGLAEDKIRHVGFYLGVDCFIHSSVQENAPYLRISSLNDPEWNGSGRLAFRAARTLKAPIGN